MKYRIIRENTGFVPQVRKWFRYYDIRRHVSTGVSARAFCNERLAEQAIIQYKAEREKKQKPDVVFTTSD